MSKTKMKRTNLYLTQNQHLEISEEAEKRGINFSEMFRKIVDNYLENKRKWVKRTKIDFTFMLY